jgi:hypothetical protein
MICASRLAVPGCDYLHGVPLSAWYCSREKGHTGPCECPASRQWRELAVKPPGITITPDQSNELFERGARQNR